MSEMRERSPHRGHDRAPAPALERRFFRHAGSACAAHARTLVDAAVGSRLERNAFDDLGDEVRNADDAAVASGPRLLSRDVDAEIDTHGVRRDSLPMRSLSGVMIFSARRVVLGVGVKQS